MRVSEAIEMLNQMYKPDDELCISWWGKELFCDADNNPCTDEQWQRAVDDFDANEGYEHINTKIWEYLNYAIYEAGDF
jgi:hypothetical protein